MKRFAGTAVVLGLVGVAATALLLWWLPANDFLFVPDRAKPLADKVVVQGGQDPADGDVYYVDLFVRRIRKLEQLLPFTRPEGSTFVPEERLLPDGTTDQDRDRQNAEDMQRSEKIAAVVALRALDSICLDEKRVLPCTAYLEGEYGIDGLYMGVPVKLGASGVEEIVKLRLTADEKKMLRASAAAVREVVGVLKKK